MKSKTKAANIITIACFISILFIPIGIVTMLYMTDWKKKLKIILSAFFTVLYAALVYFFLILEPANVSGGLKLPVKTKGNAEVVVTDADNDIPQLNKKQTEGEDEPEARLPKTTRKRQKGAPGRMFYSIMFFLFMLFLIIWQNFKNAKKKTVYENPYVDTTKYKLPLTEDARMPMVHFLKLRMNAGEKIYYATETTQKDNQGDFVVTNQRVVVFSAGGDYEFPLETLTAVSSVSNSVMLLTSGDRKYYIFMPENQMKYALAVVRWAFSKL